VAALIDTNILVYRFDTRFPEKQNCKRHPQARRRRRFGAPAASSDRRVYRSRNTPIGGHMILKRAGALREAEEFLKQFTVVYPNEAILRDDSCAAYQLNWFDADLWSYAEHYGLEEILTEDFQHDRLYGSVRVVNPFIGLP
jgi:predicted nucleic acid-binding protein